MKLNLPSIRALVFAVGAFLVAVAVSGPVLSADSIDCPSGTKSVLGDADEGFKGQWCEAEGVRQGPYREIYPSGKTRVETRFKDGKKNGDYVLWSEKGNKTKEGEYDEGVMTGEWTRWHENGQLLDRGEWKNEKPDGEWTLWYENGKLKSQGSFDQGVRVGQWTFWREDGSLKEGGSFEDGKEVCEWTQWDEKGNSTTLVKGQSGAGCKRFFANRMRASALAVMQDNGGESFSALALWAPGYRLSGAFELRGGFGGTMLLGAVDSQTFLAVEAGIWLGWLSLGSFEVELGGGTQIWLGSGGAAPLAGANLIYHPSRPIFGIVERIVAGAAAHMLENHESNLNVHSRQFRIGAELQF